MKFIKTVAVLLAVSVSLMVPSFAWDSDSFVGQDFYFYEPVINYAAQSPSLMAAGDTSSNTSVSGDSFFDLISLRLDSYINANFYVHRDSYSIAGVTVPAYNGPWTNDNSFSPIIRTEQYGGLTFWANVFYDLDSDYDFLGYIGPVLGDSSSPMNTDLTIYLDFDISSFPQFTTFELDGLVQPFTYLDVSSSPYAMYYSSLFLYVNGSLVKSFSPNSSNYIDFANFIYNSSVPITSIAFAFSAPSYHLGYDRADPPSFGSPISCNYTIWPGSVPPSFSILAGEDVLTGQAGSTQDDVNEIEGIESQWGNSMTENFNALSLDTFTYPDGLTSGFSLISGIFQDLWNAMGSYSILYVLPLTLGVILVIIGRISKFDRRDDGGSSDGGGIGAFLARRDR